MFNIGFLINTHNRVDDSRINMDLIRDLWQNSKLFGEIKIVHAFNGKNINKLLESTNFDYYNNKLLL